MMELTVRGYPVVIEHCPATGLFVGDVPGFPGAHTQGTTEEELQRNLAEVLAPLLDDAEELADR